MCALPSVHGDRQLVPSGCHHPILGQGRASLRACSELPCSRHRKSDAMWERAAGDLGDAPDPSPSDCAPSYRAGSWQAVFSSIDSITWHSAARSSFVREQLADFPISPASERSQVGGRRQLRGSSWTLERGQSFACRTSPAEGNKPPDRGEKEKKESAKNVLREMKLSYDCGLPLMGGGAGSKAFPISLSFHGPSRTDPMTQQFSRSIRGLQFLPLPCCPSVLYQSNFPKILADHAL